MVMTSFIIFYICGLNPISPIIDLSKNLKSTKRKKKRKKKDIKHESYIKQRKK